MIKTLFRAALLQVYGIHKPLIKVAFDTRRIDQNTQYNPRRNLQYHIRTDQFIHDNDIDKVKALHKLKIVSAKIKDEFIGEPEWFDTYASDLDHAMDKVFFVADGKNFDLSCVAIKYLEQLLQSRYRLSLNDIVKTSDDDLRKIIIHKDERLENSGIYNNKYSSKKNRIQEQNDLIKLKADRQNNSLKKSELLSDVINIICEDENKLAKLKLEEDIVLNELNSKKILLNSIKQDILSYKKNISEQIAKENLASKKLWSYYNSIKKIEAEKQKIENILLIKINELKIFNGYIIKDAEEINTLEMKVGDQKAIARKAFVKKKIDCNKEKINNFERTKEQLELLRNRKAYEVKQLNDKMISDRHFYDEPNSYKLLLEAVLKDKIAEEKKILKELTQIDIKTRVAVDNINQERNNIKLHIKENIAKMNELKAV